MRNKPWYSVLLIVGLVFLLASSVIGCSQSETQTETWTTYHSPTYGYTIDYPQNFDLDTSDAPDTVFIDPPGGTDCLLCGMVIHGYEDFTSIDDRKNAILLSLPDAWPDCEVISSHALDGKYEWVIEFTFTLPSGKGRGKAYTGETSDYQFSFVFVGLEEDWSKCEEIAETFIP